MAESELHRRLKSGVSRELEEEGYRIFHEPLFPPLPCVGWSAYRPDLFGQRESPDGEDFVLVECETQPSMRKMAVKNSSSIWMQTHISHIDRLRRILVIPPGNLRRLDPRLRYNWEIWIVEDRIRRIPQLYEGPRPHFSTELEKKSVSADLVHILHEPQ